MQLEGLGSGSDPPLANLWMRHCSVCVKRIWCAALNEGVTPLDRQWGVAKW